MGSSSRFFGNRPDCAYYLLLGLCGAAVFTAFGGIFTYIGYWPQMVFHQSTGINGVHSIPLTSNDESHQYYSYSHKATTSDSSIEIYSIIGPLFLAIGVGIALLVAILAIKYDCEYEPEEPKIAILRLASEMSLNMSQESKYELMRSRPMGLQTIHEIPSGSSSNPNPNPSQEQAPAPIARCDEDVEAGTSASCSRHMAI